MIGLTTEERCLISTALKLMREICKDVADNPEHAASSAKVISSIDKLSNRLCSDWVIELRNGSYFQNLKAEAGGKLETAQRFASEQEAEIFLDRNAWLSLNGGMVVKR